MNFQTLDWKTSKLGRWLYFLISKYIFSKIEETPSKALARELESKLAVETPSKKTPKKRTAAERRKTTQLTPPQTPRSKLAAEIENLSLRRSTRKSAIQATQQIKYTT